MLENCENSWEEFDERNIINEDDSFYVIETDLDEEFKQILSGNRFPTLTYIRMIVDKFNLSDQFNSPVPERIVYIAIQEAYKAGKEIILSGKTIERPRYWFKHAAAKIILEIIKRKKQANHEFYNELNACINIIDAQINMFSCNNNNPNQVNVNYRWLATEYYQLLQKVNPSDYESERLSELIEYSQYNEILSFLFNEIDYFLAQNLGIIDQHFSSDFQEKQTKAAAEIKLLLDIEINSNLKGKLNSKVSDRLISFDKERLELIIQKEDSCDFLQDLTSDHKKLASEYYRLLTTPKLKQGDLDKLYEILEFLQSDDLFRFLCDLIDNSVIREERQKLGVATEYV